MTGLGQPEEAAIALVASRFSATWEAATENSSPDAWLTIAGKRVAMQVAALALDEPAKPRLRFDRVALGLVRRLRDALSEVVPDGATLVLTVTAPIRLPAKTVAALASRARDDLARQPDELELKADICGNQVRARLVRGVSPRMPKVVGFVHNPGTDAGLLDLAQSLLHHVGAAADRRPQPFTGDRWLVLAIGHTGSSVETYRQVYAALAASTDFKEVLLVSAGGTVDSLL